ncbi:extracellular solute-binding protein [Paenibacillus sp. SYP-B3998]|uniref:Extracellular solute-binding protein n=1 Tax=Paenibacillus sp. SYP-B3998 TaxID=2678564 RepID=A0A6G3ZTA0_9BACL|nr:extracellular solute-binding protein [Paenibacillus sp. SYP-B3998]NEW04819.1 extracellular solute-binding protein [Paenibacillus sp. SYP-B3998]
MKNLKLKSVVSFLTVTVFLAGCGTVPTKSDGVNASSTAKATESSTVSDKSASELSWDKVNDPSLKGQEITVLVVDTDGKIGTLFKQFTEKTGIKVNELAVDYNSLYGKITTAALSNSSDIDVVEMDTIWAGQFFKGNIAEDLSKIVPADVQKKYTQSSLSSAMFDNHLMGIPYYSSTKHFYWNKDLLKKAGYENPPKTWDEFREVSKKLTANGVYGSGWAWKQAEGLLCDYVGMVYAFGGNMLGDNGKLVVNSKESVQALQYMSDLINVDKTVDPASLQWTEEDVKNAFMAGKIAMMSNWENMYPDLNDPTKSKVVNQSDVGLLPGQGNVVSSSVTGSEGIAIMKSSKKKQAALAFLSWIGSRDFQVPFYANTGTYPSLQELYTDEAIIKADTTKSLSKIMPEFQYGHNRPNAPGYVEWADILSNQVVGGLTKHQTPQQALDEAAKKIDEAIQKAAK